MSEYPGKFRLATAGLVAGLALQACTSTSGREAGGTAPTVESTASADRTPETSGACEPFAVYAQNRWDPLGASERSEPDVLAQKIGSFAGNEVIAVDGWVKTGTPVYPTNTPPWDSDIWFHTVHEDGWVSFPGVRGEPTLPDPSAAADGGRPAPTAAECEMAYTPE